MTLVGVPDLDVTTLLGEASALKRAGDMMGAEDKIREAAGIDPGRPSVLIALADLAIAAKRSDEAIRLAERATKLAPKLAVAHQMLAAARSSALDIDGALAEDRRALALLPNPSSHAALIFMLDMHQSQTPELCLAERKRFDDLFCKPHTLVAPPHPNRPDSERRLRVGYVGADFRHHSAASTFGSVILHADKNAIETYLYSSFDGWDRGGEAPYRAAGLWRDIGGLSPDQQAAMIRADQIDILADCAGFTAGGALEMFARKPAPIQVTGWGYATGTGLACMDYVITDPIAIPPGAEGFYTERVLYLPSMIGYGDTKNAPAVEGGPSTRGGAVTFGWLGRPNLVTPVALDAWAEILRRLPEARMVLKSGMYEDPAAVAWVVNGLAARGVEDRRIDVRGGTSREEHLTQHRDIDVVLDPFPQGGGVTIQDALLMGVPVVTLSGLMMHTRKATSSLTQCGLEILCATNVGEYVEKSCALRPTLEDRQETRCRFLKTIAAKPVLYARAVEESFRGIWRQWCAEQTKPATLRVVEDEAA